ncbi:MAG: hypothetical protein LBT65_03965, partial [Synergistaceae bacterium]|nr:hypothetical protein [Synergistaceae bacterium]
MNRKTKSLRHIIRFLVLTLAASLVLGGVVFAAPIVVKVGTTSDEPRVWNAVQKNLDAAGENIKIEIVYITPANPNEFLAAGELDLNAYQHYANLEKNAA